MLKYFCFEFLPCLFHFVLCVYLIDVWLETFFGVSTVAFDILVVGFVPVSAALVVFEVGVQ